MDAIILAAGYGCRTNLHFPKQLMRLGGKPLIIHALDLFMNIQEIDNIIITVIPETINEIKEIINAYYDISKIKIVEGGSTRQESVRLALEHVKSKRVIIHESARPFINRRFVINLLSIEGDSIIPCVPVIPTIYNKKGYYEDRDKLVDIQLPQIFNTELLKQAHMEAIGKNYSDDSSLICDELCVYPILVKGLEENFKITSSIDIEIARCVYETINGSGGGF